MPQAFAGQWRVALLGVFLLMGLAPQGRALAVCHGDCGGDGGVSAIELSRIMSIINLCNGNPAGCAAITGADKQCATADVDGSGKITAADLTEIIDDDVIGANPDCQGTPLGTRIFTIKQRGGFNTATGFFSTGNNGGEVTVSNSWYIAQSLELRAGPVNPATGIASVHLQHDVVFGGQVVMGGPTLCIKLFAEGSSGQLDCDGGSPQDLLLTVNSNGGPRPCPTPAPGGPDPCNADPAVVTANTGSPSRAGGLTLTVMGSVDNISPSLVSSADCATHQFNPPSPLVFSTERTSAEVSHLASNTIIRSCNLNPNTNCSLSGGGCPAGDSCSMTMTRLSRLGTAFNCAMWTMTDGPGRLQSPLFGEDTQVGDTANLLLIGDN